VASQQQGFIWDDQQLQPSDRSESIMNLGIRTGMYVPMLWKGRTLGVICVDNPKHRAAFGQEDLHFLISVAHYASAAVANQLLQDDIASSNRTLQGLLANFSPKLRRKLLQRARDGSLQPGGEHSNVTILMSDLRGFTRISAELDSQTVLHMLNDYFGVLGDIIFQHDGTIDKFIGDAILAVFGSPEPDEQHAEKAVRCAVAMQEAMRSVNTARRSAALPVCELGIGVHTGEVLHGFIGAAERMEFTVIGDTVNKASRYCDGAKPGGIVMGRATHDVVQDLVQCQETRVTTKHEGDLAAWVVTG
jgi:adenylate cyclase